ncbi:MAG TPA: hypothetical protein PKA37_13560 [Planctomycetota bacterium]|nr:hypothetical protein [Planctomycetota bacterium]
MRLFSVLVVVAATVLLQSCEAFESSRQREAQEQLNVDPAFDQAVLVDLAVLHPAVHSPHAWLGAALRNSARRHLIDAKRYSVPTNDYVDGIVGPTHDAPSPEKLIEPLKADAVLVFFLENWETQQLLSRGRCYASGRAVVYGPTGPIWERRFVDWTMVAPSNVTASNRDTVEEDLLGQLVSEVLAPLPPKRLE